MALPASRGSSPIENGSSGAFPHAEEHLAVRSGRLRDHLLHEHMLHEHGRTGRELNGLPLADLHHFEHVEQVMGLNDLGHRHRADVGTHPHVPAEPDGAPIAEVLAAAEGYLPRSEAWSVPV